MGILKIIYIFSANSHQNPNDIHHRDWEINPKIHLETQKTMNSQGNTEQKVMLEIA
jgi:hypothetical protein